MDDLKKLGGTIGALWNDLSVPNAEREEFKALVTQTGLTPESHKVGEAEIKKLRSRKAAARSESLKATRDEISDYWSKCGYGRARASERRERERGRRERERRERERRERERRERERRARTKRLQRCCC